MINLCNTYVEASEENLEYLLENGAKIGICPINAILQSKLIVVNEYGNLFGFNNLPKKYNLEYLLEKVEKIN